MIDRFLIAALAITLTTGVLAQQPAAPPAEPESVTEKALTDAEELYKAGKFNESLAAFQKFETQYKFSTRIPSAIYYEGLCYAGQKRYVEAINQFERMIRAYPNASILPEATLKLAEAYREIGNFPKSLDLYRLFQSRYPKNDFIPQAMMGEAWTLYKQKSYDAAKQLIQKIRSQYASDPVVALDATFLLGQVLTDAKDYDAARELYRQIAAMRDPRATEGLFLAAESMFEAKRYADAIAYYDRVQSKVGLQAGIQDQIDGLRREIAERVRAGQNAGVLQARIESLRQLATDIESRPDLRAAALFRTANCYQSLSKPEEASVVYRQFLRLYPDDKLAEKAQYGLIQSLTESHRLAQADVEAKVFEKKYPGSTLSTDAAFMAAETLFGTGQFGDAIERYRKFLTTSKDARLTETAEFRIGSALYGLKQYTQARDAFNSFVRRFPQSKLTPDALFNLGRSYFELSRATEDPKVAQPNLQQAADTMEQVRKNFPQADNLPDVTFHLGYLYSYLNVYDKSAAAFQDFITKWPTYKSREGKLLAPEATYQLARSLAASGKIDEAVATYRQLVGKYPGDDLAPFAAYEIAGVYATAKRNADMIAALNDYADKYPKHARVGDALYAVGQQLEADKKPDGAIAAYRKLVDRAAGFGADLGEDFRNAAVAGQLRIAALLEQRGSFDNAVTDCESFIMKFQRDAVATRAMTTQIAGMYKRAKRVADGFAKLDQIASQNLQSANIRIAAATSTIELALGEKDFTRAYAAALKLLADPEKDRLPALSYVAAGNALLKTDRFEQARGVFEKAVSDARAGSLALVGLGQAQLGLKQYNEAGSSFQQMIAADQQNPVRPEAELGLAKVWEATGKSKEAVDLFNKVMQSARGDTAADAASHLGNFFFAQKDYKTALAYFLRVSLMSAGPMGEEAAYRSAQCHDGLGNVEMARGAYTAYLRRFPAGKFADEAKAKLAALPAPQPAPAQ